MARAQRAHAGAVGTCPTEAGEPTGCYVVRCDKGRGLVFAVQDDYIDSFGVESYRFAIGKFTAVYAIEKTSKDEGVISLADKPGFLAALKSGARQANVFTARARNSYSTAFELTRAKSMIERVEKTCQ